MSRTDDSFVEFLQVLVAQYLEEGGGDDAVPVAKFLAWVQGRRSGKLKVGKVIREMVRKPEKPAVKFTTVRVGGSADRPEMEVRHEVPK